MNGNGIVSLHFWTGDGLSWGRDRKALQRAGGNYIKVVSDRDTFSVICTSPAPFSRPVNALDAVRIVVDALRAVPLSAALPVSCSRGWLPAIRHKRKYHYAGDIHGSDANLESALAAQVEAGTLDGKVLERGAAAVWRFPHSMPEPERQRVRDRLFGNTLGFDAAGYQEANPARKRDAM